LSSSCEQSHDFVLCYYAYIVDGANSRSYVKFIFMYLPTEFFL